MLSSRNDRKLRVTTRTMLVLAGAAVALVALAGTAFAHITVTPSSAAAGSTAELTFKVPNEENKANTVKIQVLIPTAHPIAQLLAEPVPGWTITVQSVKLAKPIVTDDGSFSAAVSEVTWSGGKIPPGEFQDFSVSADPLPSGISQLVFKAIQTYSNGDVVRWIDLSQPGQPEPDHPAPVLTLTSGSTATTASATGQGAAADGGGGNSGTAIALGAAGLAAGILGLGAGLSAWLSGRRTRSAGDQARPPADPIPADDRTFRS
jgi:uncharacterized protein YcnI